jgi:hypothetical protein
MKYHLLIFIFALVYLSADVSKASTCHRLFLPPSTSNAIQIADLGPQTALTQNKKDLLDRRLRELDSDWSRSPEQFKYQEFEMTEYGRIFDRNESIDPIEANPKKMERRKLIFENGLATLPGLGKPLSTNMFRQKIALGLKHFNSGPHWIYVMTADGAIYVTPPGMGIKHSSLSSETVSAAGWIEIIDGKIVYLNNGSGHFQPNGSSVAQVLFQLHLMEADISRLQLLLVDE